MREMICTECNGTGDMSVERANEIPGPYCRRYGCEACEGFGTIEVDDDE